MNKFKINDKVKFAHQQGSTGVVVSIREDGPFAGDPYYYVRWHYGLDVKGEPMTALSGIGNARELMPISEEEFLKMANRVGWGD